MALYTFPYVFTFVANSLDLIPSDLEEASAILGAPAWRTALDITLPLVAAGAARRVHRRVPAVDDAVRHAGDPRAARRHRHDDHQDLEPVPVSAAARTCRGGVAAAAADHRRAAARRRRRSWAGAAIRSIGGKSTRRAPDSARRRGRFPRSRCSSSCSAARSCCRTACCCARRS